MTRDERSRTIEKSQTSTRDLALQIVDLEDERDDLMREAQEWKAERDKLERINKTIMVTNRELGDALRFQHKVYNELALKAEEFKEALRWYYQDDCQSSAMGILEHPAARPAMAALGIGTVKATFDVEALITPNARIESEPSSKPETDQP